MQLPEDNSITTSRRRLYTQHSVSESEEREQSCDIEQFRSQIQKKFVRSVANKIYSFPLNIAVGSDFFSEDSDAQELQCVAQYDLNTQNQKNKQKTVHWDQPLEKDNIFRRKKVFQDRSQEQKKKIREKSNETKRKYTDLLKLIGKSQKSLSNHQEPSRRVDIHQAAKSKQEVVQIPSGDIKTKPLVSKINRLKTQPDESLQSTYRVNGITKFKR